MPILENEHGVSVEYTIPQDIKEKIPEHFYLALVGELVSILGLSVLEKDEDGFRGIDFCGGTSGWSAALKQTCRKLDMPWLWEYWNSLEWYDSDLFDGEVTDEVIRCITQDSGCADSYYLYLTKL